MTGKADLASRRTLDADFVDALLEAFVALAAGHFDVRLDRSGRRDTEDTIAYLVNLMAEEIGDLFALRQRHRERFDALIASVTDVLVAIGSGVFEDRVERTFDGSPEDVLAYLVNSAAEEVQALFDELTQKNALLEERANQQAITDRSTFAMLSAGVGHELNNPLTYAIGNLEFLDAELRDLLADGRLERVPELLQAIGEARDGVDRAARIAADLKQLTPASTMVLVPWRVDELVESSLALIRNTVNHRARLMCSYEDAPSVLADRGRVGQVLVNLVQNALHALPDDRDNDDNQIEIKTYQKSEYMVAIEVRDNGVGIPPQDLRRIFDSFYTTKPQGKGTGLGLAISKRMIADHGGALEVESVVGQGSTFRVMLRIAEEHR